MPSIDEDEFVFIMAGTTPNRKSTPVVDEWFALHYRNCEFVQELSMDELMKRTRLQEGRTPNLNDIQEGQLTKAQKLLPDVVKQAQRLMDQRHQDYRRRVDPRLIMNWTSWPPYMSATIIIFRRLYFNSINVVSKS